MRERARRAPGPPTASAAPGAGQARALRAAALLAVAIGAGCASHQPGTQFVVIDLLRWFRSAEARPAHGRFALAQHTFGGETRATLRVPVPSRVVWRVRIPRRATLRVVPAVTAPAAAAAVRFRIGVSDHRIYESLAETTLDPGAAALEPMSVDLSAYAGRKWSLFYRPDETAWRLVLAAEAVEGSAGDALWVEPIIQADADAVRRFRDRQRRLRLPAVSAAFD